MNINNIIKEEIQNLFEVRHVSFNDMFKDIPLKDNETIIVYHGFSEFRDALYTAKFGLSGEERADRRYSYETVNNPKGLFVSVSFDVIKKEFANSGVIVEFATKVSNLEAPVWAGGGNYFVQGQYTQGFESDEEREQQKLINREKYSKNEYPAIALSDRPELAQTIYQNSEQQALFIGNLNPNMIRAFWVNETLKNEKRKGGEWVKMSRNEFIKKYYNESELKTDIHTHKGYTKDYPERYRNKLNKLFNPNDDFNVETLKAMLMKRGWNYDDFVKYYVENWDDYAMNTLFYPKQIRQIKQYYNV